MANVLYLTHPTGVGFSHSDGDRANVHTDESDGVDNARFLRQWFAAYPEYLGNDFWLTGESYAGIYIPLTAEQVTIRALTPHSAHQIKIMMVGAPYDEACWREATLRKMLTCMRAATAGQMKYSCA